ncbi:class I SAM-dependent methyltransferase [Streptomyces sp. NPDC058812]|uniref:class I SAM-dependent methyltransferase n=1 Tax=unclassified Streptomyces TaxID=2593676 RepID=UPI00369757AB
MTLVADRQAEAWNGPVGPHWAGRQDRYDAMPAGVNDALFGAAAVVPGHAVGVDISAPLPERARASTAAEGIANAAYECADVQVRAFPAGGYDVVVSRGGVTFLADHAAAFRNLARAPRPGGRLAFVCPRPPGPESSRTRAGSDNEAIVLAGYEEVTVAPVAVETVWGRGVRGAVEFLLSRVPGGALPASRLAGLEEALRPLGTGTGVRMRAGVWLVTTVRP